MKHTSDKLKELGCRLRFHRVRRPNSLRVAARKYYQATKQKIHPGVISRWERGEVLAEWGRLSGYCQYSLSISRTQNDYLEIQQLYFAVQQEKEGMK